MTMLGTHQIRSYSETKGSIASECLPNIIKASIVLVPSAIASAMIWNVDTLILKYLELDSTIIDYSILTRIFVAASTFGTLLLPLFVSKIRLSHSPFTRQAFHFFLIVLLMVAACQTLISIFISEITTYVVGYTLALKTGVLYLFSWYGLAFLCNAYLSAVLLKCDRFRMVSILTIFQVVGNLVLSIALGTLLADLGVILASAITATLTLVLATHEIYKITCLTDAVHT